MTSLFRRLFTSEFMTFCVGPSFAADAHSPTATFAPPRPQLTYMGRFSVDLAAPIWELGATTDAYLLDAQP